MNVCDMCLKFDQLNRTEASVNIDENIFHLCALHAQEVIDFIAQMPEQPQEPPKRKRGRPPKNSQPGTVSNSI